MVKAALKFLHYSFNILFFMQQTVDTNAAERTEADERGAPQAVRNAGQGRGSDATTAAATGDVCRSQLRRLLRACAGRLQLT